MAARVGVPWGRKGRDTTVGKGFQDRSERPVRVHAGAMAGALLLVEVDRDSWVPSMCF